jgi:hypothetical protein
VTFNLAKSLGADNGPSFLETMVICMCIDGLCATISMTLSHKTSLASRWYVALSTSIQACSMAFVICAIELRGWQKKTKGQTDDQTSCCISVAWWGTITSCSAPSLAMRCYFVARSITCLHGVILAIYHTFKFDSAKKEMDDHTSKESDGHVPGFDSIPGTAFSAYISFFPNMLVACIGLTKLLWDVDCGKLSDWGQSAAVVTAFFGGMHWLYTFGDNVRRAWRRCNGSLINRLPAVARDLFGAAKNQDLDYARLNVRGFPHALDAKGTIELQRELFTSIRIGDRIGFKEALNAFIRRREHGEHISLDFIGDKNQTPLSLTLARGLTPYAEDLITNGASISVPHTKPAVVEAAEAGDATMLQRILDFGTCDVDSVATALIKFNQHFAEIDATAFTAVTRCMVRLLENKSTPLDEAVPSKLVEVANHCQDRQLCELVLTSPLLDRSIPGDGERFTLLQAASAYNVTRKLAELDVASLPNAERRSALLVALRHGSLEAAKLILNIYDERSRHISLPQHIDLTYNHPLDLLTCALFINGDQFLKKVLDLGVMDSIASATSYHNDENMNQKASSVVKHDSMAKLFDAPVNAATASRELLSLISTTAILEGHYESVNGLPSSDFEPNGNQVQIFTLARYWWIMDHWPPMLRGLGIEISDHWAASLTFGGVGEAAYELLDVRKLVDCLTDHINVKVEDGLRVAIEQGKAFRLYKRDKVDTPN